MRRTHRSYAKFGAPLSVALTRVIVSSQRAGRCRNAAGAISQAGYADEVLPLDRIPEAINRHLAAVAPSRPTASVAGGAR